MRPDTTIMDWHGDASILATVPSAQSPGPLPLSMTSSAGLDAGPNHGNYFDLPAGGAHSISSGSSLGLQSSTAAALAALQYLPVPVLVLNGLSKTVEMANEAMGRLLGIHPDELDGCHGPVASITDILSGKTMGQMGIDILARGSPIHVNWEEFLNGIIESAAQSQQDQDKARQGSESMRSGESTPTAKGSAEHELDRSSLNYSNHTSTTVVDISVEVLISPQRDHASGSNGATRGSRSKTAPLQANMIISVWRLEDFVYLTLTFTGTQYTRQPDVPASARPATSTVVRSMTTVMRPLHSSDSSGSSRRSVKSSGTSELSSRNSPTLSAPQFPPLGPPSTSSSSSTRSMFQKVSRLKDAIMNAMDIPAYALWKDESFGIPNKAMLDLLPEPDNAPFDDQRAFLSQFVGYSEDFKQELPVGEYPVFEICKKQRSLKNFRFGMLHPRTKARIVFDLVGDPIYDDHDGEFLGGIVMFKDVTAYTKRIAEQIEENEKQFEYIANLIPIMVWRTTPDGSHDWFSQQWYDYTGLTEQESLGAGWKSPFHPDDMPTTKARWAHSLKTGEEYITEYRCLRHDGEWRWMLGRAVPFLDHKGLIVKWFGTCTDIHELVQARQTAKETQEQLSRVIEHAEVTLWAINTERKITLCEGSMLQPRYGYKSKDFYMGRSIEEEMGETVGLVEHLDNILAGRSKEELVEFHLKDSDRWFRSRLLPLYVNLRNAGVEGPSYIDGVIAVSVDATELRMREGELKEQETENSKLLANEAAAKEASKMKSQFLANMSHEIRTPIAGVIGMSELLCDTELDEEQKEFAENINRSANSLLTVINDILDFSKVESGRLDIEDVQFNLSVVIRDISKMSAFAAQRKNLTYESFIEPSIGKDFKVMGDPGRLRQIVQNLLTNSLKFTTSGSISLSIRSIGETRDTIYIQFEVKDTGIGIEEAVRKKLFKPFSQADSSTARRFGGTGLGLTISKNLVELMHGNIELISKIGSGTTARFWLPFKKTQTHSNNDALVDLSSIPDRLQSEFSVSWSSTDAADRTPPTTPPVYGLRSEPPSRGEMVYGVSSAFPDEYISLSQDERAHIHVLVVEDNPINQQIALKTIKKLGFGVNAVWNGQEALDYLLREPSTTHPRPDIILMDVQMPIMDGYRATHTIRTKYPYRDRVSDIPIVAMTASAIQGDKEKCQKAGMDDYLSKPVRGAVLERMLLKWTSTEGRNSLALSRQQSLTLESDTSMEEASHSRSRSPPSSTIVYRKLPVKAHPHHPSFPQQPTTRKHVAAPTMAEATPDASKSRASNLSFIQTATNLDNTTTTDETRQQRRLENEEKALSLRDAKMLSATEDPREQAHMWDKETREQASGPSHPLTPGNLNRHLSEQILKDEARVGNDQKRKRGSDTTRPSMGRSKESSQTVQRGNADG